MQEFLPDPKKVLRLREPKDFLGIAGKALFLTSKDSKAKPVNRS